MIRLFAALAAACIVQGASVKTWTTRGNTTTFELSEGSAEIDFLSASTFRFQRCAANAPCPKRTGLAKQLPVRIRQAGGAVEFRTDYIRVEVSRADTTLRVRLDNGGPLFHERAGGAQLEWTSQAKESYWGLGIRSGANLDLRGGRHKSSMPVLISSIGWGLYFPAKGDYEFDLGDRARLISSPLRDRLECYFYYGPGPMAVLGEHVTVVGAIEGIGYGDFAILPKAPDYATVIDAADWREWVERASHASFSGVVMAAARLTPGLRPIAPWVPILVAPPDQADPNVAEIRRRFKPFLTGYYWEARDRGAPAFRHAGMLYSEDAEALRKSDQFMLGDELLIAPGDTAYLPRGVWTDLRTNAVHKGRQSVDARGDGTAVFARNGSIIPLAGAGRMELHYFPRLGGELFLAEEGHARHTKAHAGPAVNILRLELEPVVSRDFEWVVHNVSPVLEVSPTGVMLQEGAWRYDESRRNLHVRIHVPAGGDAILNVRLKEPL
jgi:hypothetical protein